MSQTDRKNDDGKRAYIGRFEDFGSWELGVGHFVSMVSVRV
jgi:hypothetical protein